MDIARPPTVLRRRRITQVVIIVIVVLTLGGITWGLAQLEPAPPSVERSAVWIGTVQRGDMLVKVRGPGSLVPERIWWVTALRDGRVEAINVEPGATVTRDTVLMVLTNPELEQAAVEADYQTRSAEAELVALGARLETQLLDIQAAITSVEATLHEMRLQAQADEELHEAGDVSRIQYEVSRNRVEQQERLLTIQNRRLEVHRTSAETEIARQHAAVAQCEALLQLRQVQLESLRVKAGFDGVLDQIALEVGQYVTPGTTLARVINERELKAVLRIPESQAKDIRVGQDASIDTRGNIIAGVVSRIDPAVQEGTITIDVRLTDALPAGARPDLTVDGRIVLAHLSDVLHVNRPVFVNANSTTRLFRLEEEGSDAVRVPVHLGATSVTTVQILEGLEEGDEIILSDMSDHDEHDRIRLR